MERFRQDLKFGIRLLLRQPGFTIVAVVTLALGVGANVTMVSFAKSMLWPSLPYEDPDRLVVVERWKEGPDPGLAPFVSLPALSDWETRNRVFSGFSVLIEDSGNLTGVEGDPERVGILLVSGNLFSTLGIQPFRGRGFASEDDRPGAARTVVISFALWQRRFGGDEGVVGGNLRLDGLSYTVIGVLPPGLAGESLGRAPVGEIWLPMGLFSDDLPVDDRRQERPWVTVCRLGPEVRVADARREMERMTRDLAEEYPETDQHKRTLVTPLRENLVGGLRPLILKLTSMVVLVLFIACANLVNLSLTRFAVRQQELAIRAGLGASRCRLIVQMLTETLVLALSGSLVGVLAASVLIRILPATALTDVPYADQARISPGILVFTALLVLVLTLVIGLVPALRTISPSWQPSLTGSLGTRSFPVHRRLRHSLVVVELALAFVLFTGTGLTLATFLNLRGENLGFTTERVLSLKISLPMSKYGEVLDWTAFFDQALDRLDKLPGVRTAAAANVFPMEDSGRITPILGEGMPLAPSGKRDLTISFTVSPSFFRVMGIPLVEGRTFTLRDDDRLDASRVVVISRSVAHHFWPGRSAIGESIAFEMQGNPTNPEIFYREVVGVVEDTRFRDIRSPSGHVVYVPYTQRSTWDRERTPTMALYLKTSIDPDGLASVVRSELLKIDSHQPVHGIQTLEEIVDGALRRPKMELVILSLFTGLALTLALVGVYGTVSYVVAARTREISVRMALGGTPSAVLGGLLWTYFKVVLTGLGTGLVLAAGLTRVTALELYGVGPMDPWILTAAAVALAAAAFIATLVPACMAARVDPARSLRYE